MKLINKGGTLAGNVKLMSDGIITKDGDFSYGAIASVEIVNSTSEQKQGAWLGRSVTGALIAGPVGAIIGASTRKSSTLNKVSFMITFKNGHTFFTESDTATFNKLYGRVASAGDSTRRYSGEQPGAFSMKGKMGKDPAWLKWALLGVLVLVGFLSK